MTRADALRDLAERLAEANGAVRVVSTVLGMAAIAAAEMADAEPEDARMPARPATVQQRYRAVMDAGAFVVAPMRGGPIAFAETQAAADRIAAALNLMAAVEEQEAGDAAAEG